MSDFVPSMLLGPDERVRLQAAHRLLSVPAVPVFRPIPRDPATMTVAEWIAEKLHLRAAA